LHQIAIVQNIIMFQKRNNNYNQLIQLIGVAPYFNLLIGFIVFTLLMITEQQNELLIASKDFDQSNLEQVLHVADLELKSHLVSDAKQVSEVATLDRTGTLWAPYLEWSFENPDYQGNPFDLIAKVSFIHNESGEFRQTEMFYFGNNIWKFRFTGTRTGEWTFVTSSSNPYLNGHSGKITIAPNPDPNIKGFLVSKGNKFARQVGENGELEGVVLSVWRGGDFPRSVDAWYNSNNLQADLKYGIDNYLLPHGMNTLYPGVIGNQWFNLETQPWNEHNSENPDLRTFEALEEAIVYLHSHGVNLHIWAWGDEQRKWTPIGVGGINGVPDKRLQRYIAARLGPLPGWSMGYGFDLFEWVTATQVEEWRNYMHEHLGWPHLLMAREENNFFTPYNMDVFSTDERVNSNFYTNASNLLDNSENRPVLYSRRFTFLRDGVWDMDTTRRAMWQFTMAGGAAGWWGILDEETYPNPEQMRTHSQFWKNRFLLGMVRANAFSDGYALKDVASDNLVFYKESTSSIKLNLSGMAGSQPAVAVDTKKTYAEIYLGEFAPVNQVWQAPYISDWAIAVGEFNRPILSERIFLPAVINKLSKVSSFDAFIPSTGPPGMIRDQTGLLTSDLPVSSNYWLVISGSIIFLFAIPTIYLIFKQRRTD
jgi:hypothetical protein